MKILITGVHGFVGSNLVEALKKEHTIYGLDIINPSKEGVERTFSWEELDGDQVPEVDAIIHLAGKAHDTKNQSAAEVYFKVNTGLTQKIFDYFLAHSEIKKLGEKSSYMMTYFHPRDFDAGQPKVKGLPLARQFKSYVGIKGNFKKWLKLLDDFSFVNVEKADSLIDWNKARVIEL